VTHSIVAPRGRVLVIDDDPLVGRSMARLLQSAHEVTVLTSPTEAVARIVRGERWDAILCDLMMPELSGMDVEERLSKAAPDIVPRIVYLTGGAFTDRAREFLAAGRPYLEKPVEAEALRTRVAALVEH
jgi:CheY-like chemotaxis protein